MTKVYIDSDQIKSIANSLKNKSSNILSVYQNDCNSALQLSADCIQLTGLDTTEFFAKLGNIYQQLNEKINSFADFLINNVSEQYNLVSQAISNNFNQVVGQQLSSLLGISFMSTAVGAGTVPGGDTTTTTGNTTDENKKTITSENQNTNSETKPSDNDSSKNDVTNNPVTSSENKTSNNNSQNSNSETPTTTNSGVVPGIHMKPNSGDQIMMVDVAGNTVLPGKVSVPNTTQAVTATPAQIVAPDTTIPKPNIPGGTPSTSSSSSGGSYGGSYASGGGGGGGSLMYTFADDVSPLNIRGTLW